MQGLLDEIVSGLNENLSDSGRISVKNFVKLLKKNNYKVKYKICQGELNSYYVSDKYADVTFKVK